MQRWYLWISLVLLSIGCVACASTASSLTPDQVHQQWVAAMHTNNRTSAVALLVPTLQDNVDVALQDMQVEQTSTVLGPLQGTPDVQAPTLVGAGMTGQSIWHFANRTECYTTSLAQVEQVWKVTNWQRTPCR